MYYQIYHFDKNKSPAISDEASNFLCIGFTYALTLVADALVIAL